MARWRNCQPTNVRSFDSLNDAFRQLDWKFPGQLPDFSKAKSLYLFSDYAGEKRDRFLVYSFLLTSELVLGSFDAEMRDWRRAHRIDDRRFEYKKLRDSRKADLLLRYLARLDSVSAVAVTVAVEQKIKGLLSGLSFDRSLYEGLCALPKSLPDKLVERVFRVAGIGAVLVNGLAAGRQDLIWISDDDDMFANASVVVAVEPLIQALFEHITATRMGTLQFTTASNCAHHQGAMTLLTACDLNCGYHVSHYRDAGGPIVKPTRFKDAWIGKWLGRYGQSLRKFSFSVCANEMGGPTLSVQVFSDPLLVLPSPGRRVF